MNTVTKWTSLFLLGSGLLSAVIGAAYYYEWRSAGAAARAAADTAQSEAIRVRESHGRGAFELSLRPEEPWPPWRKSMPWRPGTELDPIENESSTDYLARLRTLDESTARRRPRETDKQYSERLALYNEQKLRIAGSLAEYPGKKVAFDAEMAIYDAATNAAAPYWKEKERQERRQWDLKPRGEQFLTLSGVLVAGSLLTLAVNALYRILGRPALIAVTRELRAIDDEARKPKE